MRPTRRHFVLGSVAVGFIGCGAPASVAETITPEMFGAKGDGRTNDTQAFAALSAHVNARGGGTIVLRPVTYIVGQQHAGGDFAISPVDIINLAHCTRPITIQGNGATLRCAPGLRYGGFTPDGRPLPDARTNLKNPNRAVLYSGMIAIKRCSGDIEISDLILDGNRGALQMGGKYGPGGWEALGTGIALAGNKGSERVSRVRSHHHAQDGIRVGPALDRTGSTIITDVICEDNGRQGCTVQGGHSIVFERCKFRRTGKAPFRSSPSAGVDIEAELWAIRDVAFSNCEFSDNAGFGMVAGMGDSADLRLASCKFIGTTSLSAWPDKPGMRFNDCLFVGSINHVHGDPDPARAVQFVGCTFTDDPALSPTGEVFVGRGKARTIAILADAQNVKFSKCQFRLVREATLPVGQDGVIYEDCSFVQRSAAPTAMHGTFVGTNSIRGNVNLQTSVIRGSVTVNGRVVPRSG